MNEAIFARSESYPAEIAELFFYRCARWDSARAPRRRKKCGRSSRAIIPASASRA